MTTLTAADKESLRKTRQTATSPRTESLQSFTYDDAIVRMGTRRRQSEG